VRKSSGWNAELRVVRAPCRRAPVPVLLMLANLGRQCRQTMARVEASPPSSPMAPSGEVSSLPGLDTTGLAVLLLIFPVGFACHGSSREHVGENEIAFSMVKSCTWGRSQSLPLRMYLEIVFGFLVCYTATQLALQLQQERMWCAVLR